MSTIQPLLFDDIDRREERRKILSNIKIIREFYDELLVYLKKGKIISARIKSQGNYDSYEKHWDREWCMKKQRRFYRIGTPKVFWNRTGMLIDPVTLDVYNESSPKAIIGNLQKDTVEDFFRRKVRWGVNIEYGDMSPYLIYRYERWNPYTGKLKEGHKHSRLEQKSDDR